MKTYTYLIVTAIILGSVYFGFSAAPAFATDTTTWTGIFGSAPVGNTVTTDGSSGVPAGGSNSVPAGGSNSVPAGGSNSVPAAGGTTNGASGAPAAGGQNLLPNPIKAGNIQDLIYLIVNIVTYIGMILAILALIWVGFKFVAAQGNSDKLTEARREFLYVVIGIAILIGAAAITDIIKTTLTSAGVVDSSFFTTTGK